MLVWRTMTAGPAPELTFQRRSRAYLWFGTRGLGLALPPRLRERMQNLTVFCARIWPSAAFALVVLLNSPALLWYAPVVGLVS